MKRFLPLAAAFALFVVWLDPLGLDAQDAGLEVGHVKVVAGDTWRRVARRVAPGASGAQIDTLAIRIREANGQSRLTAGRILVYDVADVPAVTRPAPSTRPPTTTAAPTTTQPPTTTSVPSTTTTPDGPLLFTEDFTGMTTSAFLERFDWSVVDLWRGDATWQGHHDMDCGGPTTERVLRHGPVSDVDPGAEFWLCGPSGPASDHLMTSNGDDHTFGITAFSPKQTFTNADRVCWDVNLTESRGRRLWWEVQLVPADAVAKETSLASQGLMVGGVDFERGTAYLAWGRGVDGTFMKRPWPDDAVVFDFTEEMVNIWEGRRNAFSPGFSWEPGVRYVSQDRATRAHHCMVDNRDDTITFSQERPGEPDYVRTVSDVSFPRVFRVIFSAHNYNAGKDGTQSSQTWHWDNLLVQYWPES